MPEELLSSWKAISTYTGYSERTLQRWEARLGFPARRPAGKPRSAVVAITSEIDAWFASSPAIQPDMQAAAVAAKAELAVKLCKKKIREQEGQIEALQLAIKQCQESKEKRSGKLAANPA